jgi:hypothetical protein
MNVSKKVILDFVNNFEWSKWKRLFLIFLIITVIIIFIGSSTPLSEEESSQLVEELENRLPAVSTHPIFINNFLISVLMFIPALGVASGLFIIYSTGIAISAIGSSMDLPGFLLFLSLLFLPFTWLEFIAYSLAMTQSVFIILGIINHAFKKELKRTAFLLLIVFFLLLSGAFIEVIIVNFFS